MATRDALVQFRITQEQAEQAQRLAAARQTTLSALARSLLLGATQPPVIYAWGCSRGENVNETSTVHFLLDPLEPLRPDEIVVALYDRARDIHGQDSYVGPCSAATLGRTDFIRDPQGHGLHLRGSGEWYVVGSIDLTPRDGGKTYSRLTLRPRR